MSAESRPAFLGGDVSAAFDVRRIVVEAGAERPYDEAEWLDSIVVVESGRIELECRCGSRRGFRSGAVIWLIGLPLRALHNTEPVPTVLLAVSRRSAHIAEPATERA